MKLLRVAIVSADTCGRLLDGFQLELRASWAGTDEFRPYCLIGPNGAGKSQFLQVVSEIFQSLLHACVPQEERRESNPRLQFEVEYLITAARSANPVHVRVVRRAQNKSGKLMIERWDGSGWSECEPLAPETLDLLPSRIIAYTSGDNETLSLPFFVSRGGYADEVGTQALKSPDPESVPEPRLMLIDYVTHLEVLVANLLLGDSELRRELLVEAGLDEIHSFRCVVQLNHAAAPKAPRRAVSGRKGIQLTSELERAIALLRKCSTCSHYDEKHETYTFDYFVTPATREAFAAFWHDGAFELYTTLHKLAMLNDLAIPKGTRQRFRQDTIDRRFATRLPEPQDEDKVFRFERVQFRKHGPKTGRPVDYVSLSDGEHQIALLLGMMGMLASPGVLFLLDEPESHFNPAWRVQFVSRILELSTHNGRRGEGAPGGARDQECLLTTHAPFVPSDLPHDHVMIFSKEEQVIRVTRPDVETYGATFDTILKACFGVHPPISHRSLDELKRLRHSEDVNAVRSGLNRLGPSVEKAFLADHLRTIEKRRTE